MSTVGTQKVDGSTETSPVDNGAVGGQEENETVQLEKDDLFHILQNQRRRRVLKYLQDADEAVDMRDIAEQVAAWENDKTVQQITSDERQRVYIALYQSHLPKLDEKGVLNYNQSRGIVERTELANQFDPYLDVDDRAEMDDEAATESVDAQLSTGTTSPATRYYGSATFVGLLLTGASWFGLAPTAMTSYLATFITGMFALVTVGLLYQQRQ